MKMDTRQLMRDLRTAVMLNRPDAVDIAMSGLYDIPGIVSNERMTTGMIDQVILPVGETLSDLKSPLLRSLLDHKLAVGRAIGGVALAHRFIKKRDTTPKDLRRPGNDHRLDIRQALGKALLEIGSLDSQKTFKLANNWIKGTSPRLQTTTLFFLPGLAPIFQAEVADLLRPLGQCQEREVRAVLVETLIAIAREGMAETVLALLSDWCEESTPNSWVICRTLSGSWAKKHPYDVKSTLQTLQMKTGETNHINKAKKALKRHGLDL